MNIYLFISILLISTFSYVVIQSDSTDIILSPGSRRFATINNHTNAPGVQKINNAPQAKWIWDSNWNQKGCNQTIVIQKNFTVPCKTSSKLYVSANGPFIVQINGNTYMSGNQTGVLFFIEIQFQNLRQIGRNTLNIIASTNGDCNQTNIGGVIYALIQNANHCFVCPEGQYWDSRYRVCRCTRNQQCLSPRMWIDQPICRCVCSGIVCNCVCIPRLCPNNGTLNSNTCEC